MNHEHLSTVDLLARLIGTKTAKRLYLGRLTPFFVPQEGGPHYERVLTARELVKRWLAEELARGPALLNPAFVREYLRLLFAGEEREVFVVLFLDNRHRVLAVERMFFGTIDGANVHPREVVKRALKHNAAAVIFSHNHPSGVAEPSPADEMITRRLKEALLLIDIRVLDHLVVGESTVESFAERGLL